MPNPAPHGKNRSVEITATDCESLSCLLDKINDLASEVKNVSMHDIVAMVGKRWYGPLLVVPGLVMMTPIVGDIPGVPILMGVVVILISVQFLWRRKRVWMPMWILNQQVDSDKVNKMVSWLRPSTRVIDRFTRRRMELVGTQAGLVIIALMCIMISATTPLLELIPFSATLAGMAITLFGVSVLVKDGLVALIAISFSLATLVTTTSLLG